MENLLPKISIVVPSYNQGAFLQDALESIFSQGYPNLEVIVMDGGSTDNSLEIILAHKQNLKYWQSQSDGGQANAINTGMQHCTGDIVTWLNSDDWYVNEPFWIVARAFQENPGCGLFIGNGFRYREGVYQPFCPRHIAISREMLKEGLDYILQPATFISHQAWLQSGGLNSDLIYGLDWDLFIKILEKQSAVSINEFLAVSREYEQTKTSAGSLTRAKELLEIANQNAPKDKGHSPAYYLIVGAVLEALSLIDEDNETLIVYERSSFVQDLLTLISQSAHKTVTLGSAYYLLETLLGVKFQQVEFSEEFRRPIFRAMQQIQDEMKARWKTQDPFPIRMDEQDKVFIPFAKGFRPNKELFQTSKNTPKISVIIPSYNQADFLSKTLESLVNQNYPALEIIVFDGGSTDQSVEIIQSYARHLAHWQSEADYGPAHALNKGFAKATGDIIGWLNSDDVLTEGALWQIAQEFKDSPATEVVFGNAIYIDEQNHLFLADHGTHKTSLYFGKLEPMSSVPYYWTYVHAIPQPTVYFRRKLLEKAGLINQTYHFIFDFEFFWRLRQISKFKKIEKTLALYRIHSRSKTSDWNKFLRELFRFSRPLWPSKNTPEYQTVISSLVHYYFSKKYGGYRRRNFLEKLLIKLLVEKQIANPEKLATPSNISKIVENLFASTLYLLRDILKGIVIKFIRLFKGLFRNGLRPLLNRIASKSNSNKNVHFSNLLPIISPRENLTYSIVNEEKKYTITFAGFLYPRHPGHSGGEIRDFHILRKLLSFSILDFFALWSSPEIGNQDDLRPYFRMIYDPNILHSFLPSLVNNNALNQSGRTRLPPMAAEQENTCLWAKVPQRLC